MKKCVFSIGLILGLLLLCCAHSYSQKRIGVYNVTGYSSKTHVYSALNNQNGSVFGAVPAYCVDFYSNNPDFITIDRKNIYFITFEKELQKTENFMDGYVVEQGKSEGLDYLVQSLFDTDTYTLMIQIFDVKEERVLCSSEKKLDKNFLGIKDLRQQVIGMLLEINSRCFESSIPVVRMTSFKGKKAKELLVAAGKDMRVRSGYKFEVFMNVEETVGGKNISRKEVVGKGTIIKVEDENFSILEITDGAEAVLTEINKGTELLCRAASK